MSVLRQQFVEGLPPNIFHHDIRSVGIRLLTHIEDSYDSRMRQPPRSFRFAKEPLAIFKLLFWGLTGQRNGLYRHNAINFGIARFVDDTHGSPSQLGQDLVAPKTFAPAIIHSVICDFRPSISRWSGQNQPDAACDLSSTFSSEAVAANNPMTFSFSISTTFFACSSVIPFSNSKANCTPRSAVIVSWLGRTAIMIPPSCRATPKLALAFWILFVGISHS